MYQEGYCPTCGGPAIVYGYRKGISWRPPVWRFEFICRAMLNTSLYPRTHEQGWHRNVIMDLDAGDLT